MEQEWISLNEFMRRNKIGYESAIRLIKGNKVEYQKSETGQYKIKVSRNEVINETIEKLTRENEALKVKLQMIENLVKM